MWARKHARLRNDTVLTFEVGNCSGVDGPRVKTRPGVDGDQQVIARNDNGRAQTEAHHDGDGDGGIDYGVAERCVVVTGFNGGFKHVDERAEFAVGITTDRNARGGEGRKLRVCAGVHGAPESRVAAVHRCVPALAVALVEVSGATGDNIVHPCCDFVRIHTTSKSYISAPDGITTE